MFNFYIETVNSNIPSLIHSMGVGIISIFLTLIVFVYTSSKEEMVPWDRVILLKKVINVYDFVVYLGMLFLPPFFWGINSTLDIFIIIISFTAIGYLMFQLLSVYKWIVDIEPTKQIFNKIGYRQKLREDFLENDSDLNNKTVIWSSIWSKKNNQLMERRFINYFFGDCIRLVNKNNWEVVTSWLDIYYSNRVLRDDRDLKISSDSFVYASKIDFFLFKRIKEGSSNVDHIQSIGIVKNLIKHSVESIIKSGYTFQFFIDTEKHLKDKEDKYKNHFFKIFYKTFFREISKNTYQLTYMETSGIDFKKIKNEDEGTLSFFMFKYYIEWLKEKISTEREYNDELDSIAHKLFEGMMVSWLSEILTYIIRSYGKDRMIQLVKEPPIFGNYDVTGISYINQDSVTEEQRSIDLSNELERKEKRTIDFCINWFNKNNPWLIKKELEEEIEKLIGYQAESAGEEKRKEKIILIFKKIIQKLD